MPLHVSPSAALLCVGKAAPWQCQQPSFSLCWCLLLTASTTMGKLLQPPGAATSSFSTHTARDLPGRASVLEPHRCFSAQLSTAL